MCSMYNLTSFFGALRTFKNQNGPRNLKKIEQVVFMILNMEKKKKKINFENWGHGGHFKFFFKILKLL